MIFSSALNLICSIGAEIAVMASEGALIIAGAVALFILARKAYPRTHENAHGEAVGNNNGTLKPSALPQEKQKQDELQPEIKSEERPTNEKTEIENAPQEEIAEPEDTSVDEAPEKPENPETGEEQDIKAQEEAPEMREESEIRYEKPAMRYEKPVKDEAALHEQDVLELKRYIMSIKSEAKAPSEQKPIEEPMPEPEQSIAPTRRNVSHAEETQLRYVDPANPDKPREENFASYNVDEAALLHRHIEMERKRHEANAKVEQEKVDWNRVKEYNSAILSMGE
ncbi:MAG: hypothetical protein ACI4SC_00495, partial [Candidatus Neoclostridium sp.]